jgi:putative transposase
MSGSYGEHSTMTLSVSPPRYRFPLSIISQAVWAYHRFNHSYRDIQDELAFRGINVSHETIRRWCIKFANHFRDAIKKRERKPSDKWHLDEMCIKVNGVPFILWRAVDSNGYELDIFLHKRRNKQAAIRLLSRLLNSYPGRIQV